MRALLIAGALAFLTSCGPTGPNTASGMTRCQQLRECRCVPERTSDVDQCNQTIDNYETQTDPERICATQLRITDCGNPVQVDTTRINL